MGSSPSPRWLTVVLLSTFAGYFFKRAGFYDTNCFLGLLCSIILRADGMKLPLQLIFKIIE